MKDFHPATTDDEVLQEVWRIKDETAKRFRSVADYAQSIRLVPASPVMPNTTPQGARRKRRTPSLGC